MSYVFQTAETFLEPIALTIMLVYLYGMIYRGEGNAWRKKLFMGLIFGIAAAVSMHAPITLADGFILDLRNLFIGIAAAFFGVITGLITLVLAIIMRISIGGDGVVFALPAMTLVTIMGLTWRKFFWKDGRFKSKLLFPLGTMVSSHLAVGLFLPEKLRTTFFFEIAPIIAAMNLFGAVVLGRLLRRESDLLRQEQELERAAMTDPLTKLINRRRLQKIIAELDQDNKKGASRAVLFCDIDDFKEINDTFGHAAGDDALVEFARRVQKCLRPTDIFARLAGDEFVIVLPDVTFTDAKVVAERCRNAVSRGKFFSESVTFDVSMSMGVCWSPEPRPFNEELASADQVLYNAKTMGRNCVVYDTALAQGSSAIPLPFSASA